jgi:phenylacetate-CoA ligase
VNQEKIKELVDKVPLTALIFGQHYRAFRNIRRWQLEQWQSGSVLIRLVRGEEFSTQDEDEIRQKFLKIASVDAVFEFVDDIPLSKRGKFQFVIQHIQPETVP